MHNNNRRVFWTLFVGRGLVVALTIYTTAVLNVPIWARIVAVTFAAVGGGLLADKLYARRRV